MTGTQSSPSHVRPRRKEKPRSASYVWILILLLSATFGLVCFMVRSDGNIGWLQDGTSESRKVAMRSKEVSSTGRHSIVLVSMNIAGCVPSQASPKTWTLSDSVRELRTILLAKDPDVLALQECPGGVNWAEKNFPGYQAMGATWSHADQVVLLIREGLTGKRIKLGADLPAVMAEVQLEGQTLLFASVHLEPFESGSFQRREQMEGLQWQSTHLSTPLILAGDTNMRDEEDQVVEGELHFLDGWKLAGSSAETKFTWDTMNHSVSFNQYYGDSTRQYTRRYDRIYMTQQPGVEIGVKSFELIANQPLTSKYHFLSDHFGIAAELFITSEEGER